MSTPPGSLSRPDHMRRRLATTLCTLAITATTFAGASREGLPDVADTVSASFSLNRWVEQFETPHPDSPAARVPLRDASAVCVVVRHRGRVLGTGVDTAGDDTMLRRAAGRALSAVLGHPAVAALPEQERQRIGDRLTTELEVAGPFRPRPGRSFDAVAEQVRPGLDGVAMRVGDRLALRFPAQLRIRDAAGDAARVMPALAHELGLPATDLATLRTRHGVRVYTFRTIDLAQRAPGRAAHETVRGQTLVPPGPLSLDDAHAMAEGLLDHLLASLWARDEPLGVMGDFHPALDRYDPLIASPRDQALVAFALAEYANLPGLRNGNADRARLGAITVFDQLVLQADVEPAPLEDPSACAAVLYAAAALGRLTDPFAVQARSVVFAALETLDHGGSAHTAAFLLGAACRTSPASDQATLRSMVDRVWSAVPPAEQPALLPWLAWAETDLGPTPDGAQRLAGLASELATRRLGFEAHDLEGGIPIAGGLPDGHTARLVAFEAAWLRRREADHAAGRGLATSLRFLRQLVLDDQMAWITPGPTRATGGLRAAPWRLEQPVAAQAIGLLAVAEAIRTLAEAPTTPESAP